MDNLLIIGGVLLVLGGLSQSWLTHGLYRLGRQWRGSALIAGAFVLWGAGILFGIQSRDSVLGVALVWVVNIGVWGGLWLRRREQSRQNQRSALTRLAAVGGW